VPKSNRYYPRYEGSKKGQRIVSIRTSIHTVAPHPIFISIRQGKMIRGFLDFLFGRQFDLQYLLMKKNQTLKGDHFSSKYGSPKIEGNIS
jgi:hypothetical protein